MEILEPWYNDGAAHCSAVENVGVFYEVPLKHTRPFCPRIALSLSS